jgi:hypothetical protein
LVYKSASGSYFEYILVSLRFNDVFILVESIYNSDRVHFDKVKAFLDLLALASLDYDQLIVLGDFNIEILRDPGGPTFRMYYDILDSLSISYFLVPPVVTRRVSGTCIDHVLTKLPEKVASFGPRFSLTLSDHCFLSFSYCLRPPPPVDRIVSFKNVSCVDVDFLAFQVGLLN